MKKNITSSTARTISQGENLITNIVGPPLYKAPSWKKGVQIFSIKREGLVKYGDGI